MTDALRILTGNTSKMGGGSYMQKRFADVVLPQKVETRTGEEIKEHMKAVLGGLGG